MEAQSQAKSQLRREALLAGSGFLFSTLLGFNQAANAGPYLKDIGGKGILAEEEARMYQLRMEREGAAREDLDKEIRLTQEGKLCATPFGVDVVGITELITLIGALVGGFVARQRKEELERLNEQLRRINLSLRQNARAGIVYAPGLTYAPPANGSGGDESSSTAIVDEDGQGAQATVAAQIAAVPSVSSILNSIEEESMTPDQIQCRDALKQGKRLLKEENGAAAMVRFEKALMLSIGMKDKIQQRRATRGLAAAARIQGQYRTAIRHLEEVLDISQAINDHLGDADAYGTIADMYTELGEFDQAAEFYDKYISTMNTDGPV